MNTDKDKTASEEKAWRIVCEFAKLVKERTPELKRLASIYLTSGAREENLDAEGEAGLAVARLVVANDRLRKSKGKRHSTLMGVTELLPVLCTDDFEQIRMATLILGDWPMEWPALETSLEVLKARWSMPPKSDTPSLEQLKEVCRKGVEEGLAAKTPAAQLTLAHITKVVQTAIAPLKEKNKKAPIRTEPEAGSSAKQAWVIDQAEKLMQKEHITRPMAREVVLAMVKLGALSRESAKEEHIITRKAAVKSRIVSIFSDRSGDAPGYSAFRKSHIKNTGTRRGLYYLDLT